MKDCTDRPIDVDGEIILSAGALNSPQLLLLSGIGPADGLCAHGIKVELDRDGVGRNLHNHPAFALQYALAEPLSAYSYLIPNPRNRDSFEIPKSSRF